MGVVLAGLEALYGCCVGWIRGTVWVLCWLDLRHCMGVVLAGFEALYGWCVGWI